MAVEAVVWDFGGVLTTSPFEAFNRHEALHGLPTNFIRSINASDPDRNAWAQFERAEIDAVVFDELFLAESTKRGHPVRGDHVLPLLLGEIRPAMVAALRECKRRFKVGCITNNMAQRDVVRTIGDSGIAVAANVMDLFDSVVESSNVGLRKPDPRIYKMMCDRLQVQAKYCVYLDDLGINCKSAADLGMNAIKVLNEKQALRDLGFATGLTFLTHSP